MFISSSISSNLEFWLANHTLIYEKSKLKVFKNIDFLGEISNNLPDELCGTKIYKTHEFCS